MCHCCGPQSMDSENCTKGSNITTSNGYTVESCENCSGNKDVKLEDPNPSVIRSISPAISLQSSASSVSNCSDISVEVNSNQRGGMEKCSTDSSQEDTENGSNVHLPSFAVPPQENGGIPATTLVASENAGNSTDNSATINKDGNQVGVSDGPQSESNSTEDSSFSDDESETSSINEELDAQFWLLPEPTDEDDVTGSINYDDDDDDEYSDDVNWRESDSLRGFEAVGSATFKAKEEKKKTLEKVMNGKFKTFVGQLLKTVGVVESETAGDSWMNIVTSLSWKAASYIKPDYNKLKAVDPNGYVKIKCIATGLCTQSRVIEGLVFKKHAAHKRMPAKYKHPKLLLIQGVLGFSSSGLSSLESAEKEKLSNENKINHMIEMYNPNVILVEKTVSRDIQEYILDKKMTLVLDMKLHRLERVARCTGSPIISYDSSIPPKLWQCDSFYFEKFVEEHAQVDEGGKRPSKTLMFLEGCNTRQGCSILLMGANSDVLKRVKYAVRCSVAMAYHIMLETSFLLDQRAMLSTIGLKEIIDEASPSQHFKTIGSEKVNVCSTVESDVAPSVSSVIDITIPDRYYVEGPPSVAEDNSAFSFEHHNPFIVSGFPSFDSDKIFKHDILIIDNEVQISRSPPLEYHVHDDPKVASTGEQTLDPEHSHPSLDSTGNIETNISNNDEFLDHEISFNEAQISGPLKVGRLDEEPKVLCNDEKVPDIEHPHSFSVSSANPLDAQNCSNVDDIGPLVDSEGILVLVSTRNASRGTMCEHRHFSRIKFYRNFDVPLGKFLRDDLLNQKLQCKACSDPQEDHIFYYAHHNKQLTIQVRRLPKEKCLPGETEGKLWMWSRCGKCKFHNGSSKSTKRVLLSIAARGLSFGKFLELGFSQNSSFRPSSCGHIFHKDFLHFFGFGPMIAMFKYSTVATYSVSLPPEKLDFRCTLSGDSLKEFEDVRSIGVEIFQDINKSLKKIGPKFVGVTLKNHGLSMEFSDIEEMLSQERDQFEVELRSAVQNENQDETVYKFLILNRIRFVLLIESYVWDQRLHALLSCDVSKTKDKALDRRDGQTQSEGDAKAMDDVIESDIGEHSDNIVLDAPVVSEEIQIGGENQASEGKTTLIIEENTGRILHENELHDMDHESKSDVTPYSRSHSEIIPKADSLMDGQMQNDVALSLTTNSRVPTLHLNNFQKGRSSSLSAKLGNDKGPIWSPFSEILNHCMHDILENFRRDTLPSFSSVLSFPLESMAHRILADEGSKLHVPLSSYILSDYENEFSSKIACALAKDRLLAGEDIMQENPFDDETNESPHILPRFFSFTSSRWASTSSLDSHAQSSMHLEDSRQSSFDLWLHAGDVHREILLGKVSGKPKYSVICLHASQFRELRSRWCPSEVEYIASLSRCKSWDAKGGKSNSLFAKTHDGRFIIKEIKRAELDSFVKFAPEYFDYMNQCHERQNQTCLAKILGIYQIVVRQTRSGKETRHDLMVMENLSFGRNFTRSYDLKGALHARLNTSANGSGDVLLDQNFVNDMNSSPLYVSRQSKRLLQRGYWNDTTFLKSIQVMDYSLLVGVDSQRQELVCGIIDYLRQYTWDKQLETWVKSSLVPKNQLPTIISPGEYYRRFRKFIDTHFVSVPDDWGFQRSKRCDICGPGEHSSSHNEIGEYDIDIADGKSPEDDEHEDDSSHPNTPVEEMVNNPSA